MDWRGAQEIPGRAREARERRLARHFPALRHDKNTDAGGQPCPEVFPQAEQPHAEEEKIQPLWRGKLQTSLQQYLHRQFQTARIMYLYEWVTVTWHVWKFDVFFFFSFRLRMQKRLRVWMNVWNWDTRQPLCLLKWDSLHCHWVSAAWHSQKPCCCLLHP